MDPLPSGCTVYLSKEDKYEGEPYEGDDLKAPTIMDWHGQHLDTDTINRYSNVVTLTIDANIGRYNEKTRDYEDTEFGIEFPTLTLKLDKLTISSRSVRFIDLNCILGLKDTLRSLTLSIGVSNLEVISELKNLERLKLFFRNKVENLEFLRGCYNLQKLRIDDYQDDEVKIFDLSPIASLTALKSLSLYLTGFSGLELVVQSLQRLSIGSCIIHNIMVCTVDMNKLPNLQSVESLELYNISTIDSTPIDLGFLSRAPRLKKLRLERIDITNFEAISTLTELEHLTAEACFDIKSIKPLSGIKLETLDLCPCSAEDISPLRDMITLKTLNISGMAIEDCNVIATLTSLETLHFCNQAEFELLVIGELKRLKTLYLPSGRIRSGIGALRDIEEVIHEGIEVLTMTDEGESWVTYYGTEYYDSVYTTGKELVDAITSIPNFYDPSSGLFTKRA